MEILSQIFNTELLVATVRLSTPITLAAVGATICERSGIVNIAMEGMMIIGAFFGLIGAMFTGNPWLGLLLAVLAGGVFSLLHAFATVSLHLEHVVSGAVLNILAFGIVRYLMVMIFGHPGTTDPIQFSLKNYQLAIPGLSKIPILGPVLFNQTPIIYFSFILIIFFTFFLKKTKLGLHIKAAGEHPLALETIGVSVYNMRYTGVFISGMMAGLAGAYLSIENAVSFTEGMSGGKGIYCHGRDDFRRMDAYRSLPGFTLLRLCRCRSGQAADCGKPSHSGRAFHHTALCPDSCCRCRACPPLPAA